MATTQPQPSAGITSYGPPAPTSLPTPAYDDPRQNDTGPSYKPEKPGAQDSSYKPVPPRDSYDSKQDSRYDDPAAYGSKPDTRYDNPAYGSKQDTRYDNPPYDPKQDPKYDNSTYGSKQDTKYNDTTYGSKQDSRYDNPAYGSKQDSRYDDQTYRPLPPSQDAPIYKPSQPGPDSSYRPAPFPNDLAYHTLADPSGAPYGAPLPQQLPPYIPGPPPPANMNTQASNGIPPYPPPPNTQPQAGYQKPPPVEQMAGPAATTALSTAPAMPLSVTHKDLGIKYTLSSTESDLREYMSMLRRRHSKDAVGIEERLRTQAATVLGDLHNLRQEVADLVKNAESHRWRRFLVGGAIASFIPIVKRLFPRPERDSEASSDTEYAFKKSKSLISRVLEATKRPGIATVAFFVFAVLYVFQNEVSLRVGRSITKRLKALTTKVENGEEIEEEDMKLLRGWRWRVLIWSE